MKIKGLLISIFFIVFALSCKSPSSSNGSDTIKTWPPQPGEWTATAGFGSFDFTVNSSSTYITTITYNLSNWSCGSGITSSGKITVSSSPGWAISNRAFEIQQDIGHSFTQRLTISGTFTESGDQVSGNWDGNVVGSTCSGTWQGSPKS